MPTITINFSYFSNSSFPSLASANQRLDIPLNTSVSTLSRLSANHLLSWVLATRLSNLSLYEGRFPLDWPGCLSGFQLSSCLVTFIEESTHTAFLVPLLLCQTDSLETMPTFDMADSWLLLLSISSLADTNSSIHSSSRY